MNIRIPFYNFLVGLAGGCLIFMGMLMFNALTGLLLPDRPWTMLIILCCTSLVVGMLARFLQPFHGMGSAIASGLVAALLILYLWQAAKEDTGNNPVFGPAGILVPLVFSPFGAWIFPGLFKRGKGK